MFISFECDADAFSFSSFRTVLDGDRSLFCGGEPFVTSSSFGDDGGCDGFSFVEGFWKLVVFDDGEECLFFSFE